MSGSNYTWLEKLREAIAEVERESMLDQIARPDDRIDYDIIGVTLVASLVLTVLEFWGGSSDWNWIARAMDQWHHSYGTITRNFFRHGDYERLHRLAYWSICTFFGYMLVPMLWVKVVMKRSLRETGLSGHGFLKHSWIYLLLYLVVLPAVYVVSGTESFQSTYPFYEHAGRSAYDFIAWELLYALQFMSLEFFFRGFLVHGLKRRFGFYSIFVSVIPYCMIHFGKPAPEAFGSILAGLTLGAFSLFTGSIWLGVVIHISVAVSMDIFAIT